MITLAAALSILCVILMGASIVQTFAQRSSVKAEAPTAAQAAAQPTLTPHVPDASVSALADGLVMLRELEQLRTGLANSTSALVSTARAVQDEALELREFRSLVLMLLSSQLDRNRSVDLPSQIMRGRGSKFSISNQEMSYSVSSEGAILSNQFDERYASSHGRSLVSLA